MEKILIFIVIAIVSVVVVLIRNRDDSDEEEYKTNNVYSKKKLLSNTEMTFYNYFKKLEPEYIVLPQINLASIIKKESQNETYQTELFRNIDFCIFNKDLEILLAIEINDDSHKTYKRKTRDKKVREILKNCNIDLLTYNVNYPNTEDSVIERTKLTLENIINKNN